MLGSQLSLLEAKGLVALSTADPELEYAFRHPLLHEAAYASLTHADRRDLHRAVGLALETLYPKRLEELAPRLADHFAQAGEHLRAYRYYVLAGQAAQRVYANPEAADHYQHAVDLVRAGTIDVSGLAEELVDLYLRLGRVLEISSRFDEALAHYRSMEADALQEGNDPLLLAALIARGTVLSTPTVLFNAAEAKSASERALELAQKLDDQAAQAKIYWNLLLLSIFTNHPETALEYGEQSLSIARKFGLREQLGYTLNDLGNFVYFEMGDLEKSREASEEASAIWRELGNQPMLTDALTNLAVNAFISGDFRKSLELSNQAYQIAISIDNLWGQAYSLGAQGYVYNLQGLVGEALSRIDQALHLGKHAGFIAIQSIALILKGQVYGLMGAIQAGIPIANEAIRVNKMSFPIWLSMAWADLAYLQVKKGELEEAEASLKEVNVSGFDPEVMLYNPMHLMATGEYLFARGNYSVLLDYAKTYLEKVETYRATAFESYGQLYLGMAWQGLENSANARSAFQNAVRAADERQINPVSWRARARLADLEEASGDAVTAGRLRKEARQPIDTITEHAGTPELKASFLALPEVQKILQADQP